MYVKIEVIGNLGNDAQVKDVDGRTVVNFSVAHTERFKDAQGNQQEKTQWFDCAYWSDKVKVAEYLKKGTKVRVEGTPDVNAWQSKEGKPEARITIRLTTNPLLLDSKEK